MENTFKDERPPLTIIHNFKNETQENKTSIFKADKLSVEKVEDLEKK